MSALNTWGDPSPSPASAAQTTTSAALFDPGVEVALQHLDLLPNALRARRARVVDGTRGHCGCKADVEKSVQVMLNITGT